MSGSDLIVGVDSGGTFTDLVAIAGDGVLTSAKVPSTPREPADAVGTAIDRAQLGGAIDRLVHGTTVATNVILQRQGARLCLLTTASFEDLPYIQRINRPLAYSLRWRKLKPLVQRRMIVGVHERIDPSGAVVEPLTESECERVVALVRTLVERDGCGGCRDLPPVQLPQRQSRASSRKSARGRASHCASLTVEQNQPDLA